MVSRAMLQRLGGWNTVTLTEDYEFSAQCVLAGEKVHYVADAIIYDEQPLTFTQSWGQRRRWAAAAPRAIHLGALAKAAVTNRSFVCADMALTFATPLTQFASLLLGLATVGLLVCKALIIDGADGGVAGVCRHRHPRFHGMRAGGRLCGVATNRGKLVPGTQQGILYCLVLVRLDAHPHHQPVQAQNVLGRRGPHLHRQPEGHARGAESP